MARGTKPVVTLKCPANVHTGDDERVIEFSFPRAQDGRGGLPGGLISFRYMGDAGKPRVEVYREEGITLQIPAGTITIQQVYVLTGESNGSENGESDGWVIGVYGTREGADAALAGAVAEAKAAGHRVIGHETPEEEDEDEWDRSFAITMYEVKR